MNVTTAQYDRTEKMMNDIAQEAVKIDFIDDVLYVFGSELAVLRIFAKYQANGASHNPKTRIGYSKNLSTWLFSLRMEI